MNKLRNLEEVKISRSFNAGRSTKHELHAFSDASEEAYAAVVFLRAVEEDDTTAVHFVMGKARVTPPKATTIPRLELMAAKLAAELSNAVQCALPSLRISRRTLWTDSEIVLKYLNNKTRRFHTFVANRVNSVLALTSSDEWRHVPSDLNPADAASRGIGVQELATSQWLTGPRFLQLKPEAWPAELTTSPVPIDDPELKKEQNTVQVTATAGEVQTPDADPIESWMGAYSSAFKFRRAVAAWMRLQRLWKRRVNQNLDEDQEKGPITVREMRAAERAIAEWIQASTWPSAILELKRNERCTTRCLQRLSPELQGNLIVSCTRIGEKLPIIPAGHFSKLLIEEAHKNMGHMGRQAMMSAAAKHYWLLELNKQTRRIVRECPTCQRNHARPAYTKMADLPPFRVNPSGKPFESTGVDYFGPFSVRRGDAVIKVYGVIFTCAASRAVHLEVSESLSSSSFVNALRRFVCRRGHVKLLVADNGTNFTGAKAKVDKATEQELRQLRADKSPLREMQKKNIEWRFNPPGASHHGGFWERLIRTVRRCLVALRGRGALTLESLTTLFCECESIMNNRPLTVYSEDGNDLEPLTPNHLLIGSAGSPPAAGRYTDVAKALQQQWETVQIKTEQFWKRWQNEYVSDLRMRSKWFYSTNRAIRVNDIVLVIEPNVPRQQWNLGRVTQVHPGPDNEVRTVTLHTSRGELVRPITKVCLLETASDNQ